MDKVRRFLNKVNLICMDILPYILGIAFTTLAMAGLIAAIKLFVRVACGGF